MQTQSPCYNEWKDSVNLTLYVPSMSISLTISSSSDSVGFCPSDLMTIPSSLHVMKPSPSRSNMANASRYSIARETDIERPSAKVIRVIIVLLKRHPETQQNEDVWGLTVWNYGYSQKIINIDILLYYTCILCLLTLCASMRLKNVCKVLNFCIKNL